MSVMIVTSLGDVVVDLFTDRCPLTCKNFLKLCKIKYYNGCLFHTVQKDFTAQTGDPTGTCSGGDSVYKFLYGEQARFFGDEIHLDLKHSKTGTVAMASAGENMNASQFYITLRDDLDYLDGKHTVFGEVAEGHETLSRINEAYVDENSRPYKNIRIKHTYILDDPFDDPPELVELIPDASPEGKPKDEVDDDVRLEDDWVPMDETLGLQQLEEVLRAKEAHSRAVVLESIGDIPEAEIKPPDNVLFVCKLNPATEDEDLHTIFSRFGTVKSADIIRDFKTGDSLCYAFIEFEDKEACEQAYYKMDNALIDDRRIHVDFSQSVAKLWSQYRRHGQNNKGCFKCGSLDHIAKDCTGDTTNIPQHSKYTLKDTNAQHGNSSYDMVFDGDDHRSPERDKRERNHKTTTDQKRQSTKRADMGDEERDRRKEDHYSHRRGERDRDHRDDDDKYRRDGKDSDNRARDERDPRRSDRSKREDRRYESSRRDSKEEGRYESSRRDLRDDGRYEKRRRDNDLDHQNRWGDKDPKKSDDDRAYTRDRSSRYDSRDGPHSHGRKRSEVDSRKRRTEEEETTNGGDYERDSRRRH